jgi:pimeloyl-ACP methyl ester carboxylesterase
MATPLLHGEHADIVLDERSIIVEGQPVRYQVAGRGEPIVLVHGLSGSTRWWRRNISALAAEHTVLLVDLPGFGAMARSHVRFVLAEAARWLCRWMEAVELGPVNLVGHSMGGQIAIRLAARRPEAVKRLVLVAPAAIPAHGSFLGSYLLPLLIAARHTTPAFLPTLAYDVARAGPRTLLRATRDLLAQDVRANLRRIAAPTLLIWGKHDTLVPPSVGDLLCKEIPHARLVCIERAGHVVMYDQPRAFDTAVLTFLSGQSVGA